MQVTETKNEGLSREFTVRIEAKDISEKVDARLGELGRDLTLPGFRPGKAPISLLQKRYGKAVMGEVLEAAVSDSSSQAIAERGLTPAMQPRIEITSFDEGKDLEYTLQVELMPEFEPADFSSVKLERLTVKVADKEVDDALARIADQNRRTEPVAKPRKAKTGDTVVIDFVGRSGGEEFPGGAGKDFHLELGSGRFIPGFEDQLIGAKPGDTVNVNVTFPDDYSSPELAGKDAEFEVTVRELREYVASAIDDAMASGMGFENLEALRNAVRENIEREYAGMSRTALKRQLLDKLAELHDFEVPVGMVDAEFEAIWEQFEQARQQGQIDEEDQDKSDEELKDEYRAIAERRVRLGLLLSEVGRRNNVEIGQEEVNRAILAEAQRYPGHQEAVIQHFRNDPRAQAELRAPLFENKVTDFILEMVTVTDRSGTMDDLLKIEQSKADGKKAKSGKGKAKSKDAAAPKKAGGEEAGAETAAKKPAAPKKAAAKAKAKSD